MDKKKLLTSLVAIVISILVFGQKKMSVEFVFKPGISFVSGKWRNAFVYDALPFKRNLTPALETGVNAVFNFKRKAGGKVVYDQTVKSEFYLADKIAFTAGIFYSFNGQNYKNMTEADATWSRKLRLQYLKLPLQVEFIKGKKEEKQFIYAVGFYAGYLARYKETNTFSKNDLYRVVITQATTIDTILSDGTASQNELQSRPYQSLDYGISLSLGMQKKIVSGLSLRCMLNGQIGFSNILNTSAQYSSGSLLYPYFKKSDFNVFVPHANSSIGFMIGLRKTFEWTPAAKKERTRWRIFRLKE